MTFEELLARFPEVPPTLADEPTVVEYADRLDALLRRARPPSPCARVHDAANHFYLKLVGPLAIHGWGLASREQTVVEIGELLERHRADPAGFEAGLVGPDAGPREVRGPGCG
jgi:hypothetical protein